MKNKKILYIIVLFLVFTLGLQGVDAVGADAKVNCSKLNSGGNAICTVSADIIGAGIQKVTVKKLEITSGDNIVAIEEEFETSGYRFDVGKDIKIGTYKIKSLSKFGTAKILLQLQAEKDNDSSTIVDFNDVIATINVLSSTATLSKITINDAELPNFDSNTYTYTINDAKTSSINIDATPSVTSTKISGVGTKKLACGKNTFSIKSIAQDTTTSLTYKLIVNKTCDDNSKLKGITLSAGTLSPIFSPTTLEYKVTVDTNIDKITLKAEKSVETQEVTGEVTDKTLSYGDNTFKIKVTSEKGTTNTYKIIVNRSDGRSNNALLSSITLDNGKINFDKNIFTYETKVLSTVTKINITALPEDEKSKIEIKNPEELKEGLNEIIIKVTAENEDIQEYTIKVNKLKEGEVLGDNPKIQTLTITDYNLSFEPDKKTYNLKIKNDTKSLNINIIMQEMGSSFAINGNEDLKDGDIITINTTSLDGTTETYKIIIEKSAIQLYILIGAGVVLIGAVSAIIFIMSKKRKANKNNFSSIDNVESSTEPSQNANNPFDQYRKDSQQPIMSFEEVKKYDPTPYVNEAEIVPEPQPYNNITDENQKYEPNEEIKRVEITEELSKQCPQCGHRINFSSKLCPYCNKQF